jgi:hypothetical protein
VRNFSVSDLALHSHETYMTDGTLPGHGIQAFVKMNRRVLQKGLPFRLMKFA